MTMQNVTQSGNGATSELENVRHASLRELAPAVDVFENEQELLLVADLPGVEPDGLRVALDPPELLVEGRQTTPAGDDGVLFLRKFRVDERIDPDGITAELAHGVLRVHLKKSEALRPRRIEVKRS